MCEIVILCSAFRGVERDFIKQAGTRRVQLRKGSRNCKNTVFGRVVHSCCFKPQNEQHYGVMGLHTEIWRWQVCPAPLLQPSISPSSPQSRTLSLAWGGPAECRALDEPLNLLEHSPDPLLWIWGKNGLIPDTFHKLNNMWKLRWKSALYLFSVLII